MHLCRAAQGFEASQAVSLGHSVLMLHGLASAAECEALRTDGQSGGAIGQSLLTSEKVVLLL